MELEIRMGKILEVKAGSATLKLEGSDQTFRVFASKRRGVIVRDGKILPGNSGTRHETPFVPQDVVVWVSTNPGDRFVQYYASRDAYEEALAGLNP